MREPTSRGAALSRLPRRLAALGFGLAALAAVGLASPALGVDASASSAHDIEACVRQNMPGDSMTQTFRLVVKDRVGTEHTLRAKMFWEMDSETQLSNLRLDFDSPPELRGAALLVRGRKPESDMLMYLPELGKVRRITPRMASGSLLGTDFSYDDFLRLQEMFSNLETERLADEELAGRSVYVTRARPPPGSEYDRIRSSIDQETCVPLRVEFHEPGRQEPVKVLTVDPAKLWEAESRRIPREILLEDEKAGTSTRVVIEQLEIGVPINRKRFSETDLVQQGRFGSALSRY